jgi:cytochrome c oxidase assembly protein subunit 15
MGFAFAIPLILLFGEKADTMGFGRKLLIIFILGGLQGLLGWIMVQSGLIDKPWVNPLNLNRTLNPGAIALFILILGGA